MSGLLVAPVYEGVTGTAIAEALPVVGGVVSAANDFGDGNVVAGIIDVAGSALDTVSMIANPIATLASSCASFLLDYMAPLHQELELLTGSPEMVRALSKSWVNLGEALTEVAEDHRRSTAQLLEHWHGPAADGYAKTAAAFEQVIEQTAASCTSVSSGLELAATVVQIVYEIVKGIIADLVGQLIQAVIEALATVGIGLPAIVGQCTEKIASRVPQVAKWVEEIQTTMTRVSKIVEKFTEFGKLFEGRMTATKTTVDGVETVVLSLAKGEAEDLPGQVKLFAINLPEIIKSVTEATTKQTES